MYPQRRPINNTNITATWTNIPLHVKLGISQAEMDAHLALHAHVHDYEECEGVCEPNLKSEADEQACLDTVIETRKLAEREAVEGNRKQRSGGRDDNTKMASNEDVMAVISISDEATVVITDKCAEKMATTRVIQNAKAREDKERKKSGHASSETWTESPHFLWGP